MKKLQPGHLCGLAVFLAPIFGGQLAVDPFPLEAGVGAWLTGVLGGIELPTLTHALVFFPIAVATIWLLWSRKVLQTPSVTIAAGMTLLFSIQGFSIAASRFPFVSVQSWMEWLAYGVAFHAILSSIGRVQGPRLMLGALVAGCSVTSLKGVAEYIQNRAADPSWRIFADWVNPNALAGMLLLGLFPAIVLSLDGEKRDRILASAAAVLITTALILTGSKGGWLAGLVGLAVLLLFSAKSLGVKSIGVGVAILAGGVLFATLLQRSGPVAAPTGPFARASTAASNQEQSAGFRKLLWLTAVDIMKTQPAGVGLSTFKFESARPGRTQPTVLAHNTYLQLGAEASPIAILALIVVAGAWLGRVALNPAGFPGTTPLRAAVIASIVASGAHNLVDSDLYHFGIGLSFFALLAIGLQLASDGSSPELVPPTLRRGIATAVVAANLGAMLYFGYAENVRARVQGDLAAGSTEAAKAGIETLIALAPGDGNGYYMRAMYAATDATAREVDLRQSLARMPQGKVYRALARTLSDNNNWPEAISVLKEFLRHDPNNLPGQSLLISLYQRNGDTASAIKAARALLAVEKTTYLSVLAIPEMVSTEPFEARVFLFDALTPTAETDALLQEAIDGYKRYRTLTVPQVLQSAKGGFPFAGESAPEAAQKMRAAADACAKLAGRYRLRSDDRSLGLAADTDTEVSSFLAAAEALEGVAR